MLSDDELQELYDKQKLQENIFLYARAMDRLDRDLMESTYWPESTGTYGGFSGNNAGWIDNAFSYRDNIYRMNHHISNVLIELDGNRAKREAMNHCVIVMKEPAVTVSLGGRYLDLCEKRGKEWRVLNRVHVWDWFEHQHTTGGYELCGIPHASNFGRWFPEDQIYQDWASPTPARHEFDRPESTYHARFK